MKKKLTENELREMVSNMVSNILKEEFEPTQEDWDTVCFDDGREEPDLEYQEWGDAHDREEENKSKNIEHNMEKRHINEAQLRQIVSKHVAKMLKEEFEMGEELTPESLAEALIDKLHEIMENGSPEMQAAIRPDRVEGATPDALMGWMQNTISRHPEFSTIEDALNYILGDIMNGGLPSKSFAKNFFTKEAQEMYYSKNDMSHHNDAVKQKQIAKDPSRMETPMAGKMMNQKIAGLPEQIAEGIVKALRNL